MLVFGVLGWVMEEHGIPVAPLVLGMVLGECWSRASSPA
jgi:putative tricarboxylic transport membrane protein